MEEARSGKVHVSHKVTHSTGIHGTFDPPGNWLKKPSLWLQQLCRFKYTLKGSLSNSFYLAVNEHIFFDNSNLYEMNDGNSANYIQTP